MKDYDCEINYHPCKANVVANALSRKTVGTLAHLIIKQVQILRDLESMETKIHIGVSYAYLAKLTVQQSELEKHRERIRNWLRLWKK